MDRRERRGEERRGEEMRGEEREGIYGPLIFENEELPVCGSIGYGNHSL